MGRWRQLVLAVALVLAVGPGSAAVGVAAALADPVGLPAAPVPDDPGRLILLLDSSASMKEKDADGHAKITGLRTALLELIPSLEPRALVGLRVFGATVPSSRRAASCRDTQLAVPLGAGNRGQLAAAVEAAKPLGGTPIAYTLQQALKDVGPTGARSIVLVSDSEESCVHDACPVARSVASTGVDLRIDVIGLGVESTARSQLRCIATAGRGRYDEADDAGQLATALRAASLRASRSVSFGGSQVTGSQTWSDAGPALRPGLFSDRLGPRGSLRSYSLATRAGATYHLSAALRPTPESFSAQDGFRLQVVGPQGQVCAQEVVQRLGPGSTDGLMVASLPLTIPSGPRETAKPCGRQGPVRVVVARDTEDSSAGSGQTPLELLVVEEPPVVTTTGLPAGGDDPAPAAVPARQPERETTGGSSLSLAATLSVGSWSDTIKPTETLVYRVRTQWGQRAVMTLSTLDGGADVRKAAAGTKSVPIALRVLSSGRAERDTARVSRRYDGYGFSVTTAGSTARYLNRLTSRSGVDDLAGYQYFVVQAGASANDYEVPLRLNVAVTGSRTGDPAYQALASSPTPTATSAPTRVPPPTDSRPGRGRVLLLLGLGLLALAALAVVVWRVGRLEPLRRRGGFDRTRS